MQIPERSGRLSAGKGSWREPELWYGVMTIVLCWMALCMILQYDMLGHSTYDSYTLIAMAWRNGSLKLEHDYSWLELAIYNGDYYVSFPSVPALVMLPLTLIFGNNTPSGLVTGCYLLGSYIAAYFLARRWRHPRESVFLGLFMTLGCSMLDLSLSGGVWYQAQLLAFLLVTCCALGMTGESPAGWAAGLGCLALSVGCRPFQAAFFPFALVMLFHKLMERERARAEWVGYAPRWHKALVGMLPYLIFPLIVALALGWYNYARFGNPLEFGHNYLPEFTRDPETPQLALKYIPLNLQRLSKWPYFNNGRLEFPKFDGFQPWLANPLLLTAAIAIVIKLVRHRWDRFDTLILFGIVLETFLILLHKTMGSWQFGARYMADLIPMVYLLQLRGRERLARWEVPIGIFAIAFNLYGTIVFHMMP